MKPCKMSRYQSVCWWQRVQSFSIGAFSLYACCKSVFSAQSVPFGAISYLVTLYECKVCQRQERGVRFVLCVTLMLPYPPPPHCKTPTDGKSASAQNASIRHINTGRHVPSRTQPQGDTHWQYTQRETGCTHPH